MRFPSLFRLPRHQQFHIQPRYYDPVKEEIKERTEKIRKSLEGGELGAYKTSQIRFKRKIKTTPGTSMLQLVIAVVLGIMVLGWLEFGNDFFYYAPWLIIFVYFFYRIKTFKRRR